MFSRDKKIWTGASRRAMIKASGMRSGKVSCPGSPSGPDHLPSVLQNDRAIAI
jgi:hypothetical protein